MDDSTQPINIKCAYPVDVNQRMGYIDADQARRTKMAKTTANISIDSDIKIKAQKLFSELGMDLSTAINIFLHQAIRENAMPFAISANVPNKVTKKAMKDGEEGKNVVGPFDSVEKLMESLDAED